VVVSSANALRFEPLLMFALPVAKTLDAELEEMLPEE
jgi:hypothetical protein